MEVIKIGDELEVMYSLSVDQKIIREYDSATIIVGNRSNLVGLNKYLNPFIGKDKKELVGIKKVIHIIPEEAYGLTDKSKIGAVPKKLISEDVSIGDSVDLSFKNGETIKGVIKSENEDTFIVDCNHPLVNKELKLEIKIVDIK